MTLDDDDRDARDALDALYADLPTVECVGQCWNACGPISMSRVEHRRIAELGVDIPVFTQDRSERWAAGEPLHCPALDQFKQCTVYAVRPLICRVFGVGRAELACRFGCKVTGGRLRAVDVLRLTRQSFSIGGAPEGIDDADVFDDRVLEDPVVVPLMRRFMGGDRSVLPALRVAFSDAYERLGY